MAITIAMSLGRAALARSRGVLPDLAQLGYSGVEVPLAGQSRSALRELRQALSGLGMRASASIVLPNSCNPIDVSPRARQSARDTLAGHLDDAATLGAQHMVGALYQSQPYFSGREATDQEWEWARQCLLDLAQLAFERQLGLALEPLHRFEGHLINTTARARRMCADVNRDNVGLVYNSHRANIEDPDPALALPAAGRYLRHVRLAESHRGWLGTGQVKWEETFATLKFLDFQGWMTVERPVADPLDSGFEAHALDFVHRSWTGG